MVSPGQRFRVYLEELGRTWAAPLHGFIEEIISAGLDAFMRVLGKSFAPKLKPMMDKIEASTKIPPELQPMWDEMKNPTGEVAALLASRAGGSLVGGAIGSLTDWMLRPFLQGLSYVPGFTLLKPELLVTLYHRYGWDFDYLCGLMRNYGMSPDDVKNILVAGELRFPSEIVAPAWLRNKAKYDHFWNDVKSLGVSPDRIELMKEMAYRIPGVQDIIRYVVKEAYNPDIYKAFGQDQEYPAIAEGDAEKTGVKPDQLMKEWIAHWDLPSVGNGFEMMHRGVITPEELALLLKARDIMPFWRDKLTDISWTLPGRIEVRMMAQLGLVDKAFIIDILKKDGLAEEYRDVVADMNLVRGIRSDIQTRYTKGWLDSQGVKDELTKSGLSPQVADRLYQWIVSNAKPERTQAQKDLTKAEVVKAVKTGEMAWSDGVGLIMKMGYDEDEANIILAIGIPVEAEALTELQKLQIDTTRRKRRKQVISRSDEVKALIAIGIGTELANAYADNDEVRLGKVPGEEGV